MNTNNEFRKNLSVDIPDFMNDRRKNTNTMEENMYYEKTEKTKSKKHLSKRAKKLFEILAATLVATAGPIAKYNSYSDIEVEGDAATIEEIMKDEKLLEEVAISEENLKKYLEYDSKLENGGISKAEMKNMPSELYGLMSDILKDKIVKATEKEKGDEMEKGETILYKGMDPTGVRKGKTLEDSIPEYTYKKDDLWHNTLYGWASYLSILGIEFEDKTISPDIKEAIEKTVELQNDMEELEGKAIEDINYNEIEDKCKEVMDYMSKMMGKEFIVKDGVLKTREIYSEEAKETAGKIGDTEYKVTIDKDSDDDMEL